MGTRIVTLRPGMQPATMEVELTEEDLNPELFGAPVHVIFWNTVDDVKSMSGEEFYSTFQERSSTDYKRKLNDIHFYILKNPEDVTFTYIGNFTQAAEQAIQNRAAHMDNLTAIYDLAMHYLCRGNYSKARRGFQRALELGSEDVRPLLLEVIDLERAETLTR